MPPRASCAELLKRIAADDPDGAVANDLIGCFRGELGLGDLIPLMTSPNESVAIGGCFIASELGERLLPHLDAVEQVSRHQSHQVRCYALQIVENCGLRQGSTDLDPLLGAGLRDEHRAVRWLAVQILARLPRERLSRALLGISGSDRSDAGATGIVYADSSRALRNLESDDRVDRLIGFVEALRLRTEHAALLTLAAQSADEEIAALAREEIAESRAALPQPGQLP